MRVTPKYYPNARFPQLHQDAPLVPQGLKPKRGVEYGCGDATCYHCYEPDRGAKVVSREPRQ